MMLDYYPVSEAFFAHEFDRNMLVGHERMDVEIDGGVFAVFGYDTGVDIVSVVNEEGKPLCHGDVAFVRAGAHGELVGLDGLGCFQIAMHRTSYDGHDVVIAKERKRK